MKKTKVIFKELEGEVLAVFPEEICDSNGNINSYMHVGQHGACSPLLLEELHNATDYTDLKEELESIGYKLIILN